MIIRLLNILIFLICIPDTLLFLLFSRMDIRSQQQKIIRRYLKNNRKTVFGQDNDFSAILKDNSGELWRNLPLQTYFSLEPYIRNEMKGLSSQLCRNKIILLEPTSGSTGGTKLIPYSRILGREFLRGIHPWLFFMYLKFPGISKGSAYWSISPAGSIPSEKSAIPVGFQEDTGYAGILEPLFRLLFPVPPIIKKLQGIENFRHATALFLLTSEKLSLISVWNPSYVEILMEYIYKNRNLLLHDLETGCCRSSVENPEDNFILKALAISVKPRRIDFLKKVFQLKKPSMKQIWPELSLISCWTDGPSRYAAERLKYYAEGVFIQGKGLLATEGIFTIPIGDKKGYVPAFRSHYFEFITSENRDRTLGLQDLMEGEEYELIITTGGGLYRYQMKDKVHVEGFWHNLPLISFKGRIKTNDICGEKISDQEAELLVEHIKKIIPEMKSFDFLLSAVELMDKKPFYTLFCFSGIMSLNAIRKTLLENTVEVAENFLQQNFHYKYARRLGQLEPLKIHIIPDRKEEIIQSLLLDIGRNPGRWKSGILNISPEIGRRLYTAYLN